MRILQLHNRQLQSGGADGVVEQEARALAERGHEVHQLFADNQTIAELGSLRAGVKAIWNRQVCNELRSAIDQLQPAIVHVHTPFPLMSPAVFRTAKACGIPTVATVHSFRYSCVRATCLRAGEICTSCLGRTIKLPAVRHRCYKDSLPGSAAIAGGLSLHHAIGTFRTCVDRFLALTQFMADRLVEDGIPPERVMVKPNFVSDRAPVSDERDGSFLYVGRLVPEKGIRTVLDAWSLLDGPSRLIVVGDGPLRDVLADRASADERIETRGWLEGAEVHRLLSRATALIVASEWYEGLPLTILESFAAGTPVITSDVPNLSTIVTPGRNGLHFRAGEPASLADNIRTLQDSDRAHALGLSARAKFEERYSEHRVIDLLEEIYKTVAREHRTLSASSQVTAP
jgi:glycosyltransferase involved in cell wall biosynthesis